MSEGPLATRVSPSPTAELEGKVEELMAQGVDVCRLGLGEPDIETPEHVREAGIRAIQEGFSRYTSTAGIVALRQAAADRLHADLGIPYAAAEVVMTVGGKQAIFNALAALCGQGDEVLIPVPYWVSFPEQVRLVGGTPVFVPGDPARASRVTVAELERHATPRTRVLILNTPNNPSGAVYPRAELDAIASFCAARDIWVISDEVYRAFTYTPEGHVSIASRPNMRDRTVVVDAVSKTYGMTGWRIGYSAAPVAIARAMTAVQSHVTSNPTSIAQRAALAALSGPQDWIAGVRADYRRRRDELFAGVRELPGLACEVPDGSFFLWVDASWWIGRELAGRRVGRVEDFATILLDDARVAVMPGSGFGSPTHLRMSFAAPAAELREGLARMRALLGAPAAVA